MDKKKIKKPNLFIVGVARAGTSSWYDYLKQHPEVFMSEEQRPNFFGEHKETNARYFDTEEKYLSLFKEVKNEKIIGESSHLFGSITAPAEIKKFNPKSKIIILLRNPLDVLRSAIDAGRYAADSSFKSILFTFRELLYSNNLKRWINIFGPKNIHIIIFDDYVKDIKKEYKKTCDFLGIDNTFEPEFKKLNYSYIVNYSFFMKTIFYLWNKLPKSIRLKIKIKLSDRKKKIQERYRKVDHAKEIRTDIPEIDRKEIQNAFFLGEIEKTEKLLDRNLDIWKY